MLINLVNEAKNLKHTTYYCLCQPACVTNCDKSLSFSNTFIAFPDDSTLGTAGRFESDLCSNMIALFESYSVV